MVTDPGAHRLRRHSEQALRFPCVGWMAETGIVDEASWTGRDTSKRQELPRFKHDLPHPTSLESGKVFRNHESSDSPLAVPYQINPFGFSMQANFVRMRGLTPFALLLLNELDGATHSNDGVFVLAATNTPWHLDSAFRRPGRFDDILFVPPPDAPAREAILRVLLANKPVDDIDYRALAARTEGFSGADLKSAVERAIEATLDASMKKGRILQLNTKDLTNACKATRPSTKEWFATARNHALYSNQSGVYDDILEYLKITK